MIWILDTRVFFFTNLIKGGALSFFLFWNLHEILAFFIFGIAHEIMQTRKRKVRSRTTPHFFISMIPGRDSKYWHSIVVTAFEKKDQVILSILTDPQNTTWIVEHLKEVPEVFRYLLFLKKETDWIERSGQLVSSITVDELLFCISETLMCPDNLENEQRCLKWIHMLPAKGYNFGYEVHYIAPVIRHYHKLEEETKLTGSSPPSLSSSRWTQIWSLSAMVLKSSIQSDDFRGWNVPTLPFCFWIAYGRQHRWETSGAPFLYLNGAYLLTMPLEGLKNADTSLTYMVHLHFQKFLYYYETYHKLIPMQESLRLAQLFNYLTDAERFSRTRDGFSHSRSLAFDPCHAHHPHVWMFWFELIALNVKPQTSYFYPRPRQLGRKVEPLLELFYKNQLGRIRERFLLQLTSRCLFLEHSLVLKRYSIKHKIEQPNVKQFIEKHDMLEEKIMQQCFPMVLWDLVSLYVI